MSEGRRRVLFLCTGNSARSQMAEAILKNLSAGGVEVESAGSHPKPEIHPLARRAVADVFGLDMAGQRPKSIDALLDRTFDCVISVCDRAAAACPVFPGNPDRIRWSLEDPAAVSGTEKERARAFEATAKDLAERIRGWLAAESLPRPAPDSSRRSG
jgi:ArsR family transcriptional regulator, arsenate/arsenite/antimonite-responsive transcriptional repressor / arsenate reductase (thioredoxin)